MKKLRFIQWIVAVLVCSACSFVAARAQSALVKASLDSTYVIIGNQTMLHLEATIDEGKDIAFPTTYPDGITVYDDTLVFKLEVVNVPKTDTVGVSNGRITLRQDLTIMSFDSASLYIPALPFIYEGDTVYSNDLALKVIVPFEVEVDPQKFFDIKEVRTPKFSWADFFGSWVFWLIAGLIVLGAVAGFIFYRMVRKRKEKVATEVVAQKQLPPHEVALQALAKLYDEKLWQAGKEKRYYTELTDILRSYVEARYGLPAMEKTSDEILYELRKETEVSKSSMTNLNQILKLADLVKFAKYKPLADENELSFMNAKMFVSQTVAVQSVDTSPAVEPAD